jgi:hypothetical protein
MILYIEAEPIEGSTNEKVTCHLCGETYLAQDMRDTHRWAEEHNLGKHKEGGQRNESMDIREGS